MAAAEYIRGAELKQFLPIFLICAAAFVLFGWLLVKNQKPTIRSVDHPDTNTIYCRSWRGVFSMDYSEWTEVGNVCHADPEQRVYAK